LLSDLTNLITKNPNLLRLTNERSGRLAIHYAVKNCQIECADFLYKKGQRIGEPELLEIIRKSKTPDKHYLLLSKINEIIPDISNKNFDEWCFNALKYTCFDRNDLTGLERLLALKGITDWGQILTEYRTHKHMKLNTQFIRDITLKYLLDD
jgi:hypothetical protein